MPTDAIAAHRVNSHMADNAAASSLRFIRLWPATKLSAVASKAKASNSESGSLTKETVGKVIQKNAKAAPQGRLNPRETGD